MCLLQKSVAEISVRILLIHKILKCVALGSLTLYCPSTTFLFPSKHHYYRSAMIAVHLIIA